jgi:hypothetical protein
MKNQAAALILKAQAAIVYIAISVLPTSACAEPWSAMSQILHVGNVNYVQLNERF